MSIASILFAVSCFIFSISRFEEITLFLILYKIEMINRVKETKINELKITINIVFNSSIYNK